MASFLSLLIALAGSPLTASQGEEATPRLILQVTVDQLRGDVPLRNADRLEGGLRWLLDHGVWFANAHHAHATTDTTVGHTALATGAHPCDHGMIANEWFDIAAGRRTYNLEDLEHPLVGAGEGERSRRGRSPRRILSSTFADELAAATDGEARIVAVAVKDRAAIPLAGRSGRAFWFSGEVRAFVSSAWYGAELPGWASAWNAAGRADAWGGEAWELLAEPASYRAAGRDAREFEMDLLGFGRVFPHVYPEVEARAYGTLLKFSPAGDELTLDFALAALEAEDLGADEVCDLLAVGFSSTDYVGHAFGPTSLEAEDNLLRLDRTLGALLEAVDERVGLERTLVVLSADHGVAEAPEVRAGLGLPGGRMTLEDVPRHADLVDLAAHLGLGDDLVLAYTPPWLYLDGNAIERAGHDLEAVERAACAALVTHPGVAEAFPRHAILAGALPDTPLARRVSISFHAGRSGSIYVVPAPFWIVEASGYSASHGSPWRYDTHVPVVFAGDGLSARRVQREVATVDVAATLAARLGILAPSACAGEPLGEVLR